MLARPNSNLHLRQGGTSRSRVFVSRWMGVAPRNGPRRHVFTQAVKITDSSTTVHSFSIRVGTSSNSESTILKSTYSTSRSSIASLTQAPATRHKTTLAACSSGAFLPQLDATSKPILHHCFSNNKPNSPSLQHHSDASVLADEHWTCLESLHSTQVHYHGVPFPAYHTLTSAYVNVGIQHLSRITAIHEHVQDSGTVLTTSAPSGAPQVS